MWHSVILACPICFQVEDSGVTAGVRAAVIVLGLVTTVVLVGFAVFARRLVRHEALHARTRVPEYPSTRAPENP